MSLYLTCKALHILSVMIWLSGMIAVPYLLPGVQNSERLRRYNRRFTNPALGLAWIFGLYLVHVGHWQVSRWFQAKLVLAVLLSALHGSLSGRLRRGEQGSSSRHIWQASLIIAAAAIFLVIFKP